MHHERWGPISIEELSQFLRTLERLFGRENNIHSLETLDHTEQVEIVDMSRFGTKLPSIPKWTYRFKISGERHTFGFLLIQLGQCGNEPCCMQMAKPFTQRRRKVFVGVAFPWSLFDEQIPSSSPSNAADLLFVAEFKFNSPMYRHLCIFPSRHTYTVEKL